MSRSEIITLVKPAVIVAVLLIYGCAHKPENAPEPTQPQTQTPATKEQPRVSQDSGKAADAQTAAGHEQLKTSQNTGKSAEAQLQAAREKLQVSQDTEKKVQAEFEQLRQSGQASDAVEKDYEAYLSSIKSLVAENREIVSKLEAAMAVPAQNQEKLGPGPESTDETAQLDRQLNQALSKFDEMLLKEMELIRAQSDRKMTSLAEEAAAAADRLRKKGIDVGGSDGQEQPSSQEDDPKDAEASSDESESASKGSSRQTDETDSGGKEAAAAETEAGTAESRQAKAEQGGDGAGKKSQNPDSGYSDEDDDIVARQLREAAEDETDPELKEKLWKEYEDYKRNTR